jgi:hypothetical protein
VLGKVLLCEFVALLAPLVCLVYRGGIFNTPDDPESPHGHYEPKMRKIYEKYGKWVGDYWWLGIRNRAYGLRFNLKPELFRAATSYDGFPRVRYKKGLIQVTDVAGYKEYILNLKWLHIIYGYRMGPVYNTKGPLGSRQVNMDARPILSIRSGEDDN